MEKGRELFSFASYILPERQETKITNERQAIIKDILDEINKERVGTEWKPITAKAVAMKVAHLSTNDLRYFFSVCKKADHFGKCFFGRLKVK